MFSAPRMTFYSHDVARMVAFYEAAGFRRTEGVGGPLMLAFERDL